MKKNNFLIITTSELAAFAGVAHGLACIAVDAFDAWTDPDQFGQGEPRILGVVKKMGHVVIFGRS